MTTLVVWFKRLLVLVFLFVLLIILVSFTLSNASEIDLSLLAGNVVRLKISSVVIIAFLIGSTTGLVVSALSVSRLRLKIASLKRKLERRDDELQNLRSSALKGLKDA
ncbi:LapA family protein [Candidatus Sororendozoicomonas aggregata]|uniref:LapA family protein n=1 Tax=Candidatus Sororendozoicomonas aggregata TaxID=3073239 RepID=UPI002ED31A86